MRSILRSAALAATLAATALVSTGASARSQLFSDNPVPPMASNGINVQKLLEDTTHVSVPSVSDRCGSSASAGFAPRYADVPQMSFNACLLGENHAQTMLNAMMPFYTQIAIGRVSQCFRLVAQEPASPWVFRDLNRCITNG